MCILRHLMQSTLQSSPGSLSQTERGQGGSVPVPSTPSLEHPILGSKEQRNDAEAYFTKGLDYWTTFLLSCSIF